MIDTYKYVNGIYSTTSPRLEPYSGPDVRGNSKKLAKNQVRLNIRGSFFAERVVSTWNSLPESVVTAPSINAFKNRLDKYWATLPILYNPNCI